MIATDLLVGAMFLLAAVAASATIISRFAIAAVGVLWLLATIEPGLGASHRAALAVCLLLFPATRIPRGVAWILAALALVTATGVVPASLVAAVFASIGVSRFVFDMPVANSRPFRSATTTAGVSAMVVGVFIGATAAAAAMTPRPVSSTIVLIAYEALLSLIAIALVISTRLHAVRRADVPDVSDAIVATGGGGIANVESALRDVLNDARVRILVGGEPESAAMASGSSRREVLDVFDGNEKVATLEHQAGSISDQGTADSIAEAIRLTIVNDRANDRLQVQVREIEAARSRIDSAADERRRELARRLQRDVLTPITEARSRVTAALDRTTAPEVRSTLGTVARELAGAEHEVRNVVTGTSVGVLTTRLSDALRSLAALHHVIELSIDSDVDDVRDVAAESSLRFVASELVTNALKHSSAHRVQIRVLVSDDELVLSVIDNGVGGADPHGFGLTGVARRIRVNGGRWQLSSPRGVGTIATAAVPINRPSSSSRR